MAIDTVFVDPTFNYIVPLVNVFYNSRKTSLTATQILAAIFTTVQVFKSPFYFSKFTAAIDGSDAPISGNDTHVLVQKRFLPLLNSSFTYALNFHQPIANPYPGFLGAVSSTGFTVPLYSQTLFIDDDGNGNLRTYYLTGNTKTYVAADGTNTFIGTVNYATGLLSFTLPVSSVAQGSEIGVYILPKVRDVTGAGQLRIITAWNGSTKVATISPNWTTTPDGTSTYVVGAQITAAGDGQGFSAYGIVTSGAITSVPVTNKGNNYTYVTITATANGGSGANLYASIPPRGGHGTDAVAELFGVNVILSCSLNGSESNTISTGNEYRVLGVVADPLLANGSAATGPIYDQTTKLTLTSLVGTFSPNEIVTGQTSGATGYLVDVVLGVLRLVNVTGTYANGENVLGNISAAHGTISAITPIPLQLFHGDVLTLENRVAIARANSQSETLQLILEF